LGYEGESSTIGTTLQTTPRECSVGVCATGIGLNSALLADVGKRMERLVKGLKVKPLPMRTK